MMVPQWKCEGCGERIAPRESQIAASSYGDRRWHFHCLTLDKLADETSPLSVDSLARYACWRIIGLVEANAVLRQRTETLGNEVERLMRAQGASEEDIGDFRAEFHIHDGTDAEPPLEER